MQGGRGCPDADLRYWADALGAGGDGLCSGSPQINKVSSKERKGRGDPTDLEAGDP